MFGRGVAHRRTGVKGWRDERLVKQGSIEEAGRDKIAQEKAREGGVGDGYECAAGYAYSVIRCWEGGG
ncbi:hypothetical protein RA266_28045, partial [Pseudomonas syringae pv. tagetis]|uniref:hypothetical protein n=1 Tax=Pseudomonas syringae group genomosp. 7 TaxID=251699 RepID=UPI00376F622C